MFNNSNESHRIRVYAFVIEQTDMQVHVSLYIFTHSSAMFGFSHWSIDSSNYASSIHMNTIDNMFNRLRICSSMFISCVPVKKSERKER
jgi:hypothetical protein